jgi:flavin-dependent dehydrogenase
MPKHGAQFVLSVDGARDRFAFADALRADRCASAYQVKRQEFDAMLQANAVAHGATLRWDFRVRAVCLDAADHIAVVGDDGEQLRARYLVDATGQAHVLARQLGLRQPISGLKRVALYSHFAGVPREAGERAGDIIILWNPTGWFWIIPFKDGTTSIGMVGDPVVLRDAGADDQERFDNLCAQTAVHQRSLGERQQLLPLQRHADYSFSCTARSGDRFVILGDAAGFIDPIFSTGVYLAQQGAWLAADAILPALSEGRLPGGAARRAYENQLDLAMRRYKALVMQFYDGDFMDSVVRARRREHARRALTSVLAGDVLDEDNPLLRMGMLG